MVSKLKKSVCYTARILNFESSSRARLILATGYFNSLA